MSTTNISFISTSILIASISSQSNADMQLGKDWLYAQNSNNTNNSTIANSLQINQETAETLQLLQTQLSNNTNISQLLDNETSTEGLVRIILLSHSLNTSAPQHQAWEQLKFNQNDDGGFAHIENWQSNPLDTAFFLLALYETDYISTLNSESQTKWQGRINKAIHYLATQQREEGNYSIAHLDDLYTSSHVLSALTPYLTDYPQHIPLAQKLVTYLESKQTAPATWSSQENNKGLFLDALVADSLYPYQSSDNAKSFSQAFEQRSLSLQNPDGSWQQDGYVTALVLRAMDGLSKPAVNPILSAISLSVVDAETGIPLSGVSLISKDSVQAVSASSDADGRFLIQDSKAGNYIFVLSKDGYAPVQLSLSLKRGQQLNFGQVKLSRAEALGNGQIQGKVTDDKGNAIVGAEVKFVLMNETGDKLDGFDPIIVKSSKTGNYQVVLTDAQQATGGYFRVTASSDGYMSVIANSRVQAGSVVMFNPILISESEFNASLVGTVVDASGQPLSGVDIVRNEQTATTDASGGFNISQLTLGAQQWKISKEGYHPATVRLSVSESVNYDLGTVVLQKITLSNPSDPSSNPTPPIYGSFKISAIDSVSKKAIVGFTVMAEKINESGEVVQTQSISPNKEPSSSSELTLSDLTTGKWRLKVSHPSYQSQSQTFKLTDNQTIEYKPALKVKSYLVSGTVVDSQTNIAISNAPVKIIDDDTTNILYEGKTDSNGHFVLPNGITANNLKVEVTPDDYLSTTRYVSREFETTTNVDMGEIRLRPKSAEVVLADLHISDIDTTAMKTDQQSLAVSGSLVAKLVNKGNKYVTENVTLTAFEDKNQNRMLDEGEQVVGTTELTDSLAYQKDNSDDTHANVTINISGTSNFRDAPIAVMVDSEGQVAEKDEGNNVRLTSDGIEIRPKQGTLEAEEVWHWQPSVDTPYPSYNQVMASPVVAPLVDTNSNGKIDENDDRFVLFTSYEGDQYYGDRDGVLRIINAKDGTDIKSFGKIESNGYSPAPTGNVSLADLDKDGVVEILVTTERGVSCYNLTSGFIWHTDVVNNQGYWIPAAGSIPNIFDIDSDGNPEIVVGYNVLDKDGNLIYQHSDSWQGSNEPNVFHFENQALMMNGGSLIDLKTNKVIRKIVDSGIVSAIFNADTDSQPEIAIYTTEGLSLYELNGSKIWGPIKISNRNAGNPIIADMDGDSIPDIGIATENDYIAIRSDGSQLWSIPVSDYSSSSTSSTVFDFENDGKSEVVYADEYFLRIVDGASGTIKFETGNRSGTLIESPIIADGDNDGHADIFVISNNMWGGEQTGVRMFSSLNKDWANTRHIWNQHNYHITNINDDMTVPKVEEPSWLKHNTYRLNTILESNPTAAADLTASYIQVNDKSFLQDSRLTARIGNAGGKTVPKGTPVSFYRVPQTNGTAGTPELLQTVTLTKALIAGSNEASYEDLSIKYKGSLADFGELVVVANDAGAGIDIDTGIPTQDDGTPASDTAVIQEYTRNNNIARLSIDGGTVALTLTGNTDKTIYTANTDVKITAIPTNIGSFPTSPIVKTEIIDSAGNVVAQLAEQKVDLTSALITDPSNSQSLTQSWNTSTKRTGDYTARITLWKSPFASSITGSKPEQVAQVDLPFTIIADIDPNSLTNSLLFVDKAQYLPTDQVQIHSRIMNTASNAIATQRDITLAVTDPNGNQIWTQNYSHEQLVANAIKDRYFTLPLTKALTGNYTLTQSTTAPDGSQAEQIQTQTFSVLSANDTGYGITGSISSVNEVQVNEQLNWSWQVNNASNTDISNIPLSIALYQGDNTEPFDTLSLSSVNIDKDGKVTGTAPWTTVGNEGDIINAVLVANFNGKQQGLASAQTTLVEPPIDISIGDSTDTSNYQHAPLLVYYSCEEGWKTFYQNSSYGLFDFPCFDERANTLKYYLDSIDVPYKLVKRPEHFADQLQSGLYQQYWLVGALEELRPHTRKELTELANTGDNLLLDSGINSWVNQDLLPLAGGKYGGRLLLSDGTLFKQDNYLDNLAFFSSPQIASTPLTIASREQSGHPFYSSWAIQLQPKNNTSVWANYGGQRKRITQWAQNKEKTQDFPAIISQKYGNGEPVALGFDLINSLDLARKPDQGMTDSHIAHWQSALKQLLSDRQANDRQLPTDYVPQEVVHIPLNITNPSNSNQQLLIDIDLPIGSQWLGYEGGMTKSNTGKVIDSTNNSIHYQVTLKSGDSLNDLLTIRLPASSGTHAVRVTVSDNHKADDIKLLDQYEARYLVRSIDSRVQLLGDTINSWNILGTNGFFKLNAKMQMTNIRTHRSTGVKQLAVYEASRLATTLAKMQTKDDSSELAQMRYEADELMRALQIDWYIDRDGYVPLP